MKPSDKAIEAASSETAHYHAGNTSIDCGSDKCWEDALTAAYAIDVDPLLAHKEAEIRVNNALVDDLKDMVTEKDEEIKRFRQQWFEEKELYDDVFDKWQAGLNRIEALESALRQQQDECERFHKPA